MGKSCGNVRATGIGDLTDDVGRVAVVKDPQLGDDLLLDGRLDLEVDHLLGDDGVRLFVTHAVYHAPVTRPWGKKGGNDAQPRLLCRSYS